jgi:hypothetical protein
MALMRVQAVVLTMHSDGKTFHLTLPVEGRMAWNTDGSGEGKTIEEFFDVNFKIRVTEVFMITD